MTEKLFYNSPFVTEWNADILDIIEKEGKYLVLLDKTAFYPEGGGQPSDSGYIEGIQVLDVFEEGKNIYHIVTERPQKKEVSCKLDYERRYDLMQQHTGQHLLSSVFFDRYKGETSSFHLGEDYVSIDISLADIPEEIAKAVENEVNSLISRNLEIKTYIVDYKELSELPLRKYPKVEEDIRIVEIDKLDYSPCCGTHLSSTGELGLIKILKTEKYKGITRVYFKCGKRAFEDYSFKHNTTLSLGRLLAVDLESLQEKIRLTLEELKESQKEARELKESLYVYEARDIIKVSDSEVIVKNFKDRSFEEVQGLGRIILQSGDYLLILSSLQDNKLWLAHNGNFDMHCGKFFKENLQVFSGRGGGGDKQAQASFENNQKLLEFETFLQTKAMEKI